MEVSARREAMTAASERFGAAFVEVGEIERAVQRACETAAAATGDAGAAAQVVQFCDRVTVALDAGSRELARGGRRAAEGPGPDVGGGGWGGGCG